MQIVTRDDWVTAQVIVKKIMGEDATKNSVRTFNEHCASKPSFPKPSKLGKRKIYNYGEVLDWFDNQRYKQVVGKPRKEYEDFV